MGAHTFGKPHFEISMFPYTWTRSSFLKYIISPNLIPARAPTCGTTTTTRPSQDDQGYFDKVLLSHFIVLHRWFFTPDPGSSCDKVGDAFGNLPK